MKPEKRLIWNAPHKQHPDVISIGNVVDTATRQQIEAHPAVDFVVCYTTSNRELTIALKPELVEELGTDILVDWLREDIVPEHEPVQLSQMWVDAIDEITSYRFW